jgi:UDPglucose 6-dehydrogenase
MDLAIVGAGYVGLVSGVCLAAKGHNVVCVDVNPTIVARLNDGEPTIYEKGLPELLTQVRSAGRFRASADLSGVLDQVELVIVAVGTPTVHGIIDLQYVRAVAQEIGLYVRDSGRHISIVVKSTVVPGTTDTVVKEEVERASGKRLGDFGLGMNPEFLREGEAIEDFAEPDRIVLGYEDDRTLDRLERLYAPWDVDKVRVNTRTAELIKYANNALLATQISAVNEIANLAAALGGVDVLDVMRGVHLDKRWNPILASGRASPQILTYLVPGCGFGGSCFPKDVQALRAQGQHEGLPMRLLSAVLDVNDAQPEQVIETLRREVGELTGRRVLVLGLAFKPGTDDVRESASLKIVAALISSGALVTAHDPIATEHFRRAFGRHQGELDYVDAWEGCLRESEVIVIATRWPEYQSIKQQDLSGKVVFDARRMFEPGDFPGARYLAIGRRVAA